MENQKEWNDMVRREAKQAPQPALADERAVWQAMCAICTVDQINKITDYVLSRRAAQPAESTQHQKFSAEEVLINPEKPWGFSENIQVLPEQDVQQCPYCGPVCYGGSEHTARAEDKAYYVAPNWRRSDDRRS